MRRLCFLYYAPYVQDTAVSFEYDIPSLPEFQSRIRTISEEYPYLVCEIDGLPAGYAYAHRLFSRAAYQWDAELSIYLDPQFHSMGIGSRLYAALIALLKMQNICGLYALVTAPMKKANACIGNSAFLLSVHITGLAISSAAGTMSPFSNGGFAADCSRRIPLSPSAHCRHRRLPCSSPVILPCTNRRLTCSPSFLSARLFLSLPPSISACMPSSIPYR